MMIRAIIGALWISNHDWIQTSPIWICYNFIISWNFLHIQFTSLQYQSIPYEVQSTSRETYFVIFQISTPFPITFPSYFLASTFLSKTLIFDDLFLEPQTISKFPFHAFQLYSIP
jgi:hypothetical protein